MGKSARKAEENKISKKSREESDVRRREGSIMPNAAKEQVRIEMDHKLSKMKGMEALIRAILVRTEKLGSR